MSFVRYASTTMIAALLACSAAMAAEPEDTMVITLKDGEVTVALRPDLAVIAANVHGDQRSQAVLRPGAVALLPGPAAPRPENPRPEDIQPEDREGPR